MNFKLAKKRRVEGPRIPGEVYKGWANSQLAMLYALFAVVTYLSFQNHLLYGRILPAILLFLVLLEVKFMPARPKSVFIGPTTVKTNLGKGKVTTDQLSNYYLYLHTAKGRSITGYTYRVSLQPKTIDAKSGVKNADHWATTHPIPLSGRILTPTELKNYVEDFQRSIDKPMEMLFDSDRTLEEYQTCVYYKNTT